MGSSKNFGCILYPVCTSQIDPIECNSIVFILNACGLSTIFDWLYILSLRDKVPHHLSKLSNFWDDGRLKFIKILFISGAVTLCTDTWTPESGLVTAAFKLKRKPIQDFYQKDLKRMYGARCAWAFLDFSQVNLKFTKYSSFKARNLILANIRIWRNIN